MNSTIRTGRGSLLNDAVLTLMLASLLGVMIGLGFSAYGLQHFGGRSQILCRISAGLLVPLVIVRFWGHIQAKRSSYVKTDLALFLLPLILLPCAAQIAGGASLAMTRSLVPAINTTQASGSIPAAVINPLTGKPVNGKSLDYNQTPSGETVNAAIPAEGPIILNPNNYENTFAALYDHPAEYVGRVIKMDGFAYPEKSLPNGEWIVGRLLMVCCPGDGILVGFPAKMPEGFKSDSVVAWWQIEGTLETLTIGDPVNPDAGSNFAAGEHVPCIKVTNIEQRLMQADPYLYPQ